MHKLSAHLLSLIVLQLLFVRGASATAPAPDVLESAGKTYSVQTNSLSGYLAVHPDALPKSEIVSSTFWRGYIATSSLGKKDAGVQTSQRPGVP